MFYKNTSCTAKTFYGVTFKPGETQYVDDVINNKWFVPVDTPSTVLDEPTQQKPSPENRTELSDAQPATEVPSSEPTKATNDASKPEAKSDAKPEEKQAKGKKS